MIIVTTWNKKRGKTQLNNFIIAQQKNNALSKVKKIVILADELPSEVSTLNKVEFIKFDDKPRFKILIQHVKSIWAENELYAIVMPTVYFDDTIEMTNAIYWKNKIVVLSRWQKGNVPYLGWQHIDAQIPRWDTWINHDVWLFKDEPKQTWIGMSDERIDLKGFSARIANHLITCKYDVANYTYDIRTYEEGYCNDKPVLRPMPLDYPDKHGYILPTPIWQWENPQVEDEE